MLAKMRTGDRSIAIIFACVGLIFGFAGLSAGIYFGVMKPALDAGAPLQIPTRAIVVVALLVLVICLFVLWMMKKRRRVDARAHW